MAENVGVQLSARSARCAFDPEEIGGGANKGDNLVWLNGEKLGKEIIFAAEIRHRRDPAETIVAARTPEAGRQPGRHDILIGEIGSRRIDDGGSGIDAGLDRVWLYELLAEAVDGCAGDLVKGCGPGCDGLALVHRKAGWQSK